MSDFDFRAYLYISILAVLADRDSILAEIVFPSMYFNPRGPCGPRPTLGKSTDGTETISILAVLADRDEGIDQADDRPDSISILAVLADRDGCLSWNIYSTSEFQSSRSLRTATLRLSPSSPQLIFQSSRSLRTATPSGHWSRRSRKKNFNPCGPCGPRLWPGQHREAGPQYFNPRGPCGPRPLDAWEHWDLADYFNPRGPCGPRRFCTSTESEARYISILAVLADRDLRSW